MVIVWSLAVAMLCVMVVAGAAIAWCGAVVWRCVGSVTESRRASEELVGKVVSEHRAMAERLSAAPAREPDVDELVARGVSPDARDLVTDMLEGVRGPVFGREVGGDSPADDFLA